MNLRRLICRAIGHAWGWPDILGVITPIGLRFLPQWRECRRCGHREEDANREGRIVILPQFQGNPNDCAFSRYHELGEKVKREMGWG